MKTFFLVLLTSLSVLTLPNFVHSQGIRPTGVSDLSWMLGTWRSSQRNKTVYEVWSKVSNATFEGEGYITLSEGSKRTKESLRLVSMGREIFYLAKVQENPLPVPFKLIAASRNKAIFENSKHTFPRKITYERRGNNLIAVLEGKKRDSEVTTRFELVSPNRP